ncbi:MAG TPA: PQQ-binding-like beta-propeller repeat protein [Methylibium sp.]|nr:PQQ-binding-like beta-propeller repeat protein [Methylibium sp.]
MKHRLPLLTAAAALLALAGCATRAPLPADPGWALHGQDLGAQRHSPLAQIHAGNVERLRPAWTYRSGISGTFQATPIVVGRTMYLSLPLSSVVALDAASGRELWRYTHRLAVAKPCCGPANRGVAVAGGKVYVGTVDGRLIALDAADGRPLWDVTVADYQARTEAIGQLQPGDPLAVAGTMGSTGVSIGAAPLVHEGRVYVGISGVGFGLHPDAGLAVVGISGRYGRPGLMAAFDAATGEPVWRFQITGPGWEGEFRAATPDGLALPRDTAAERAAAAGTPEAWRHGGGSVYATPAIDAERGLLIFGSGNPSPQMADASRPGDNLYTSSLIALDLKTGRRVWHYQQVPHDRWGYDVASAPVLLELERGGERVPAVAQASKLGWVYVHDRRDGRLLFKSEAFVPQSNLLTPPQPGAGVLIAPGIAGGANWSPSAWDAQRGLFFVGALHLPTRYTMHGAPRPDGSVLEYASTREEGASWGTLSALDLAHGGRLAWQVRTEEPLIGGVLATAGGLVFSGAGQGWFAAFDSATGRRLWQHRCEAGVNAPPISYAVDGRQYIAVAAGGNALFGFKQGDTLEVFALP